jgi:zinc transport system ATP-binding protein
MNSVVIKLDEVSLKISNKLIVENITLNLIAGKITTLIGPNGGGKTSIGKIIAGIFSPTSGKISKKENLKIGYMPQKINFEPIIPLTVNDFLFLNKKISQIDETAKNLIDLFTADKFFNHQITDLSGGQLQKILFIRSLINNPELLILDEPTQYLDIKAVDEFYQMIDLIRKKNHSAILLISHDLYTVMQKTDFVFCINNHICCSGAPEDINNHPQYLSLLGNSSNLAIYQHHHNHNHS